MRKIQHHLVALTCILTLTTTSLAQETAGENPSDETVNQQANTEKIGGQNSHLTDALAQWLANGNQAEIQLGQLAEKKASSQEVKQFAQQIVKDHTAYLQKLQEFTDKKLQITSTEQTFKNDDQPKTAQTPNEQPGEERVAGFRGDPNKHSTMEKIGERAGEIHLQMTKELLNNYQGHAFDMAFVGDQISAHTRMLANLKAMEEHTKGEFATVVKEGIQTTESHLKEAKELSEQLQNKGRQGAQQ